MNDKFMILVISVSLWQLAGKYLRTELNPMALLAIVKIQSYKDIYIVFFYHVKQFLILKVFFLGAAR